MGYACLCGNLNVMGKWWAVALHGAAVAGIWIAMGWEFRLPDVRGYLILAAVMAVRCAAGMYNYQLIPTSKAAKGMIPAAETVIRFRGSRVRGLPSDPSEQLTAKMSGEEAEAVRRWETSAGGQAEIWIVRKVPFAFMIALGFTAWMIFRIAG